MHAAVRDSAGLNVTKAESNWPTVVVAGAYQTGLLLMRNLIWRGVKTVAFDCNEAQPGFQSVYGKTYLCPNPDQNPGDWLAFMLNLAGKVGGKPVLISSSDQFVSAIATHIDALRQHFIFSYHATALQASLATKEVQYALAAQHGMPIPRSQFVTSREELSDFVATAHFPCLIKPLHCREWEQLPKGHPLLNTKLAISRSADELKQHYQSVESVTSRLVVQEVIAGPDTAKLVYLSCYGQSGNRLGSCVVRELRTDIPNFGSASVVEPIDDPETHDLCDNFFRSIGYSGICELEVKRDTRDGTVKLIEGNPRYSVTADAAPYAGVDIGWLHYLDLIGVDVQPVRQRPAKFRHIVLQRDFLSMQNQRRAGMFKWTEWLGSYRSPVYFYDFDFRDWRVSLRTLRELFKIVVGPSVRRIIPKRPVPQARTGN